MVIMADEASLGCEESMGRASQLHGLRLGLEKYHVSGELAVPSPDALGSELVKQKPKKKKKKKKKKKGRKEEREASREKMAIVGDLKVSATLASYHAHPVRTSLPFSTSKVKFSGSLNGGSEIRENSSKWPCIVLESSNIRGSSKRLSSSTGDHQLSPSSFSREAESFLLNAINMSFFDRLNLAWKIIFPSRMTRRSSNARIAKQRLKMILFSDRCAVSDEAKQKIVTNIVDALSDFVEIESQDKVQLTVSTDADLGTVYSVTVPVRRVKPEYLDEDEVGAITNIEYKDTGERSGSVDVRFDFFIPDENAA